MHGGFEPAVLHACLEEVAPNNLESLRRLSGAGALLCCVFFLLAILGAPTTALLWAYGLPALGCFAVRGFTTQILHRFPRAVLPVWYALLAVCCLCALVADTALQPRRAAVTFLTLMLALPLVVPDVPWRIGLFLAAMAALFCLLSLHYKSPALARQDIVHCASFYLAGLVIGYHVVHCRLNDLLSRCLLRRQRDTDCLTGLSTRRYCEDSIMDYLATSREPAALLLLDVDCFKAVNDRWGHDRGDALLQLLSERLRVCFRRNDILGRLGGDEFIAFLPSCQDVATVEIRARAMLRAVDEASGSHNIPVPGISMGIAMYPANGLTFDALYRSADSALYTVKAKGRGDYAFCDEATSDVVPL